MTLAEVCSALAVRSRLPSRRCLFSSHKGCMSWCPSAFGFCRQSASPFKHPDAPKGRSRPSSQNLVQESTSAVTFACSRHKRCSLAYKAALLANHGVRDAVADRCRDVPSSCRAICPAAQQHAVCERFRAPRCSEGDLEIRCSDQTWHQLSASDPTNGAHNARQGFYRITNYVGYICAGKALPSCLQPTSWSVRTLLTISLRTLTQLWPR